ncbi:MAG: hypothetical protein SFW36_08275 [Leptolyngbyaceae cyanobacterium bins.59]|nr:hypothetical protein [Leptolyngbyaceae cyanobacterium bins.59]
MPEIVLRLTDVIVLFATSDEKRVLASLNRQIQKFILSQDGGDGEAIVASILAQI